MGLISAEWGQDLDVGPDGKLIKTTIWDSTRQNIERLLLTNPAQTFPSGKSTAAEYCWHPQFGLGLRSYLGELHDPGIEQRMHAKCIQSIKGNPNVAPAPQPVVVFEFDNPFLLKIFIDVFLKNGLSHTIGVEVSE